MIPQAIKDRIDLGLAGKLTGTGERSLHLYVEESAASTLTFNKFIVPIKEQHEAFFITRVKYWCSLPADAPGTNATELVRTSLQTVSQTAQGDWSQPQTIDMYAVAAVNHNDISVSIDRSNGGPEKEIGELFPYNKLSLSIQSTNASAKAWCHARLYGIVIPITPSEFAWICNNYTRWGRGNVAFTG